MRDSEKKENGRWDREESTDKTIDIPSFVNGASSENMEQNFEQKFYAEYRHDVCNYSGTVYSSGR